MFYVHGIFSTNEMKSKEIEAFWRFCMHFDRHAKTCGATFSKIPAHYPDPGEIPATT